MRSGRLSSRTAAVVLSLPLLFAGPAGVVGASAAHAAAPPKPVELCRVHEPALDELSGLAAGPRRWYAVADGGSELAVHVLDPDCTVRRVIRNPVDPYDVEDLALGADGTLWLADIGDNRSRRDTVALHEVSPDGTALLHRLTYPDGARDAEALILGRDDTPYLITKTPLGPAGVYRPAGPMATPGPTALEKVGTVAIDSTDTPGGPVPGGIGSVLITGGATGAEGNVVALRTYTDAYLYPAAGGDVPTALNREPIRVPLPGEPQGEAVALTPEGTLLSASEGTGQPVRAVRDATALVATDALPSPRGSSTGRSEGSRASGNPTDGERAGGESGGRESAGLPAAGVAVAIAALLVLALRRRKSATR